MPDWYCYILIALLGKSAEFKFEMFVPDQTFGKKEKETMIVFSFCFFFFFFFFVVFLVRSEQDPESQAAFRIDL